MKNDSKNILKKKLKCYICDGTAGTIDHVIPKFMLKAKGILLRGLPSNYTQYCCFECNNRLSVIQSMISNLLLFSKKPKLSVEKKLVRHIISEFKSEFGVKVITARNRIGV